MRVLLLLSQRDTRYTLLTCGLPGSQAFEPVDGRGMEESLQRAAAPGASGATGAGGTVGASPDLPADPQQSTQPATAGASGAAGTPAAAVEEPPASPVARSGLATPAGGAVAPTPTGATFSLGREDAQRQAASEQVRQEQLMENATELGGRHKMRACPTWVFDLARGFDPPPACFLTHTCSISFAFLYSPLYKLANSRSS